VDSIHRAGLLISGFVTALAVAAMFTVQGYLAAQQAQTQSMAAVVTATQNPTPDPTASPTDTPPLLIYIQPAQPAPPATPAPAVVARPKVRPAATPPVVHVIVTTPPSQGDDRGGDD